jgi:putative hemolysin
MAKLLLDCEPLSGLPWHLSLATEEWEREEAFRLRYEVFAEEQGHGVAAEGAAEGMDVDPFDHWCEHLCLRDEARGRLIGTYRLIPGPAALRHGGFYSGTEFDLSPLTAGPAAIAPRVLEVGRTCVAGPYRNGLAMQFLWYGLEMMLQREGYRYLLGCASFSAESPEQLARVYGFTRRFAADPEIFCRPVERCRVAGLPDDPPPATEADEKLLPPLIRGYLKLGAKIAGPPAWDPDFGTYDLLVLFRRDAGSDYCAGFLARMERQIKMLARRRSSSSGELVAPAIPGTPSVEGA